MCAGACLSRAKSAHTNWSGKDIFLKFFVTTPKGLEDALTLELANLGLRPAPTPDGKAPKGGVHIEGPLEDAYRVCLESRVAGRVLLELKQFDAATPDQLYSGVRAIRWGDHIPADGTLVVDFTSRASQLQHSQFGAQKTKDAIVDQFQRLTGSRPSVERDRPSVRVNVHVVNDRATVSIDLSGESLHLRGYRTEGGVAPLKENLAAAILWYAGWPQLVADASATKPAWLLDPMAGSGTLVLEALGMALGRAPGIAREYWGFSGWLGHVPKLWEQVKAAAAEREASWATQPLAARGIRLFGFDRSDRALAVAQANARRLGSAGGEPVTWERRSWPEDWEQQEALVLPEGGRGILIANPPYGERIGDRDALVPLYGQIGDGMKKKFKGWKAALLVGDGMLAKKVGLKADRRIPLWNGPIECRLLTYSLF